MSMELIPVNAPNIKDRVDGSWNRPSVPLSLLNDVRKFVLIKLPILMLVTGWFLIPVGAVVSRFVGDFGWMVGLVGGMISVSIVVGYLVRVILKHRVWVAEAGGVALLREESYKQLMALSWFLVSMWCAAYFCMWGITVVGM